MDSYRSSEPAGRVVRGELARLRLAVHGGDHAPGLVTLLPMLQISHRRELTTEPHWSKEELVRHPEPRELIRSMRKPGNLDAQGRPTYTLDERRTLTADVYENRALRQTVDTVHDRLAELTEAPDQKVAGEARALLRMLDGARRRAPFLDEVQPTDQRALPTATLTQDPLYRRVMALRAELQA